MTIAKDIQKTAQELGATLVLPIGGTAMTGVYYPHRATSDAYLFLGGPSVHCLQCDQDFPVEELTGHIQGHGGRSSKLPVYFTRDGKTWFEQAKV